jgi:hypothetical protein
MLPWSLGGRCQSRSQLLDLGGEAAEVGSQLQDVSSLAQDLPGASEVVQGQVGPPLLEQGLHREPGNRVGEQRPQASSPGEVLLGPWDVAAVQGDAGRDSVDQRGHDVVVQLSGLQHGQGLPGQELGLAPVVAVDGQDTALGQRGRGGGPGPGVGAELDGLGQDRIGAVGLVGQHVGDALQHQPRCPPAP